MADQSASFAGAFFVGGLVVAIALYALYQSGQVLKVP